jgi:hypothetical protein
MVKNNNHTKSVQKLLIGVGIALFFIVVLYLIVESLLKSGGNFVSGENYPSVEECLKNKEIILYINSANPTEALRNIKFSEYLTHIKIKNCFRNPDFCREQNIKSFPTWTINGVNFEGEIGYNDLLKLSGCVLK